MALASSCSSRTALSSAALDLVSRCDEACLTSLSSLSRLSFAAWTASSSSLASLSDCLLCLASSSAFLTASLLSFSSSSFLPSTTPRSASSFCTLLSLSPSWASTSRFSLLAVPSSLSSSRILVVDSLAVTSCSFNLDVNAVISAVRTRTRSCASRAASAVAETCVSSVEGEGRRVEGGRGARWRDVAGVVIEARLSAGSSPSTGRQFRSSVKGDRAPRLEDSRLRRLA